MMLELRAFLLCLLAVGLPCAGAAEGTKTASSSDTLPAQTSKKWIVVNSVRYPTEALRKLALMPGWRLVVVADQKTPIDAVMPSGVDFLDIETQAKLNFSITKLLPFGSYSRKNLGYLWAIQHGAKTVFECDDDTSYEVDEPIAMLPKRVELSMFVPDQEQSAINYFPTYGHRDMWPRGFPLERVRDSPPRHFRRAMAQPYIQQGLITNGMDLDALYSITHGVERNFTMGAAVVVPDGAFVPVNSRNTIFRWPALWGLLLPTTPTSRVTDIWRGYWAQRLVHDIGGHAAVFKSTAVRNETLPRKLLHDVELELAIYRDAGRLVSFLTGWTGEEQTLPGRMVELAKAMAKEGFWGDADVALTEAWIKDLDALGYSWPLLAGDPTIGPPPEPNLKIPAMFEERTDLPPRQFYRQEAITLILTHATNVSENVLMTFQRMYRPLFGKVVQTGFIRSEHIADVLWEDCQPHALFRGTNLDECHAAVMQRHPVESHGGYLVLQGDTLINPCVIADLNLGDLWLAYAIVKQNVPEDGRLATGAWRWHEYVEKNRTLEDAMRSAVHALKEASHVLHFNATEEYGLGPDGALARYYTPLMSNMYFLPAAYRSDFIALAMHFAQDHVYTEVALAFILGIMLPKSGTGWTYQKGHAVPSSGWTYMRGDFLQWGAYPRDFLTEDGMADNRFWIANLDFSHYLPSVTRWWTSLQCPE